MDIHVSQTHWLQRVISEAIQERNDLAQRSYTVQRALESGRFEAIRRICVLSPMGVQETADLVE